MPSDPSAEPEDGTSRAERKERTRRAILDAGLALVDESFRSLRLMLLGALNWRSREPAGGR
jgi:hypothetical protein